MNNMTEDTMTPADALEGEGFNDFFAGIDACPYEPGFQAMIWAKGHQRAQAAHRRQAH